MSSERELSPAERQALQAQLQSRQLQLREELSLAEESTRPVVLDQQLLGRVSRIDAIQQQEVAKAGETQAREELRLVTIALQRIESGDYGYCQACDELISPARLAAQPHASMCINCQAARE